ncbi:hypothetical protein FF38_13346 [Lucilia cuprina]|uniref:Uncharacterized protein n=1 Tax=Lucilia cuprina TaxID=7375 RepID=A0A0L0BTZ9_LUCCU|nr:hypothetical protein FF38_13346 [Lucilia cuprina]
MAILLAIIDHCGIHIHMEKHYLDKSRSTHKVHCSEDLMRVEIGLPEPIITTDSSSTSGSGTNSGSVSSNNDKPQIYLEGLKGYPDERCHPEINGSLAVFRLSLSDFYECGVTRMVNQLTPVWLCKYLRNMFGLRFSHVLQHFAKL